MLTDSERAQAAKNKKSRKKAIAWFCKDCIYDDHARGTWREQTQECPSKTTCPLWNFRPLSRASTE